MSKQTIFTQLGWGRYRWYQSVLIRSDLLSMCRGLFPYCCVLWGKKKTMRGMNRNKQYLHSWGRVFIATYFENLIVRLHIINVLNMHVKFRSSRMLSTI